MAYGRWWEGGTLLQQTRGEWPLGGMASSRREALGCGSPCRPQHSETLPLLASGQQPHAFDLRPSQRAPHRSEQKLSHLLQAPSVGASASSLLDSSLLSTSLPSAPMRTCYSETYFAARAREPSAHREPFVANVLGASVDLAIAPS